VRVLPGGIGCCYSRRGGGGSRGVLVAAKEAARSAEKKEIAGGGPGLNPRAERKRFSRTKSVRRMVVITAGGWVTDTTTQGRSTSREVFIAHYRQRSGCFAIPGMLCIPWARRCHGISLEGATRQKSRGFTCRSIRYYWGSRGRKFRAQHVQKAGERQGVLRYSCIVSGVCDGWRGGRYCCLRWTVGGRKGGDFGRLGDVRLPEKLCRSL